MATVTTVPVDPIINRVLELLKDVTNKEDDCQILQTDLRRMESLLQDIDIFLRYQQKEPSEIVKIWLQLLQNSLTQAKILLNQLGRRQSYLDSVVCNDNPRRLSKEIREWKAFFNHLSQRFVSDWFEHIGPSGNAINNHLVGPIIKLLEDVINKEDNCQILQTDLRRMERLLQDITTLFRDEPDITTLFQRQKRELLKMVKKWLQLLQNSLTEADGLLDRSAKRRTFAECVMREPRNLFKEISEWSASFDKIYDSIQSDLSNLVTSPEFFLSKPLYEKKEMFPQEAATSSEFEGSGFIDAQDQVEKWLNEGDHVHVIGVYGIPRSGKTHLLQFLCNKYRQNGRAKPLQISCPQIANPFHSFPHPLLLHHVIVWSQRNQQSCCSHGSKGSQCFENNSKQDGGHQMELQCGSLQLRLVLVYSRQQGGGARRHLQLCLQKEHHLPCP